MVRCWPLARAAICCAAARTTAGRGARSSRWASFDRGETWPVKRLVYPGLSAYSSLAAGPDGSVYLLFERGEKKLYEHLAVVRFNLPWVLQGEPTGSGKVPTSSTDGGHEGPAKQ